MSNNDTLHSESSIVPASSVSETGPLVAESAQTPHAPNTTSQKIPSTEILARRYDKSLSVLVTKTGIGLCVGVVASVLFFRRKTWPIAFGTGFGAGMAYSEGEALFNPARMAGYRVVREE